MRRFAISGAAALFLTVLSTNGFAKPPIPVTDCETITKRGNYILQNDLVLPAGQGANGNCLVISASHVNVDLKGRTIASACFFPDGCPPFAQGGIGISVEADHVSITNGHVGEGGGGSGFTVGIFGEGDHISVTNLGTTTDVGIVLNDVSHSAFANIGYEGIPVSGPVTIGPVLSVSGGGNNTFESIKSSTTTAEGIIVTNSSNNVIEGANISCAAEGVAGPGILLTQNSNQNFLANNNVFVLFGNGIEVDLGSDQNVVQNNTVETATSPPGYFALFDQNSDCGSNIWTDNVFSNEFVAGQISANPVGCIH
jgi:Right handed beta helix region